MLRRTQNARFFAFSRCRLLHCSARHDGRSEEEEEKEEEHGVAPIRCDAIVALCEKGELERALEITHHSNRLVHPAAYRSLLKLCSERGALQHARYVYAHMTMHSMPSATASFDEHVVLALSKCGDLESALCSFRSQPARTKFSWNALISGYADAGDGVLALEVYARMLGECDLPNEHTYNSLLKACGTSSNLQTGKAIHTCAWKAGLQSHTIFSNSLVSMYSKCAAVNDAEMAFQAAPQPDVLSFTLLTSVLIEHGFIEKAMFAYTQMQKQGVASNEWSISTCLRGCAMLADDKDISLKKGELCDLVPLDIGRALHNDATLQGLERQGFVGSSLLRMYSKCSCICEAEHVFCTLLSCDIVSWTAMVLSYVDLDNGEKALKVYQQMVNSCMSPDLPALCAVLQACSVLVAPNAFNSGNCHNHRALALETGQALYAEIKRKGLVIDSSVGNTLVHLFVRCERYIEAETIFADLHVRDVASWTAMLPAYTDQGQAKKALQLYQQMQKEGVSPDEQTFANALKACFKYADEEPLENDLASLTTYVALEVGRGLHLDSLERGYDANLCICTELVALYGKCGGISEAEYCFKRLLQPDNIAYVAMLSAYVNRGESRKALELYSHTFTEGGVKVDDAIMGCILQCCSTWGSLVVCLEVHHSILLRTIFFPSLVLTTRLIFAYASCGSALDSHAILQALSARDVVTWNAFISGCIHSGDYTGAFQTFNEMKLAGIVPNQGTFLVLLIACCHAGLVTQGIEYFKAMKEAYKLTPQAEHYGCMLDLLGRAGDFDKIKELLSTMQVQPELAMWLGLLGACQIHDNVELGKHAYEHVIRLQPRQASAHALMSNIYMNAGMQDHANEVNLSRQKASAWKKPGQSFISINGTVHSFIVRGERTLPEKFVTDMLHQKHLIWRQEGYIPQTDFQSSDQ